MGTDSSTSRAVRLVEVDPSEVVIDGNVRVVDLEQVAFKDLVASIAERGVLTPCRGYSGADGVVHVTEGQRRTLAAVRAGARLPVFLAADADVEQAERILSQLAENDHRAEVGTSDRVGAYEQLALLGISPAQIAKRTRRGRAEVDAALAIARSEATRTHLQSHEQLTIAQAAILAEFAEDEAASEQLAEVAEDEPGMLEHAAQRLRDERATQAVIAEESQRLAGEGLVALTEPFDWAKDAELGRLARRDDPDRKPLSIEDEDVRGCEALRFRVRAVRAYREGESALRPQVEYLIVGYRAQGFMDRYGSAGSSGGGPMTEQEKAERREVIENNKAWDSAQTVRREWLHEFGTRTSAPKGAVEFIARQMAGSVYALDKAIRNEGCELICDLLSIPQEAEETWRGRRPDLDAYLNRPNLTSARATQVTLMMLLASIESTTGRHTWREGGDNLAATYLLALAQWGYTLSPVELLAAGVKPKDG